MNHKITRSIIAAIILIAGSVSPSYAHVTVRPNEVGVGQFITFTMGVPPEKKVPTTEIRLVIPDGLESIRPLVKPGWKIEMKKESDKEDARITEILWTGGAIPSDQKDEFSFSAKAPAKATTLQWKAYQTYSDGTIVAWDQPPAESETEAKDENKGPYSQTKIIDDLVTADTAKPQTAGQSADKSFTQYMSLAALALSIISLALAIRKK